MSAATDPLRVEFRVQLSRAYHVGAGHGRGTSLDSALFTEEVGGVEVPTIRYAHGVLRQAVFDLLQAPPLEPWRRCPASGKPLPDGAGGARYCTRGEVACAVCRIFGSPARPSAWAFSSMRPSGDGHHGGGPMARVVSRASVDPRTRRARDRTLFSEELGAPLTFAFTAECASRDHDEALNELALLVAASRTVTAVGADRRRGRGECSIQLVRSGDSAAELGEDALQERFAAAWLERDPDAAVAPEPRAGPFAAPTEAPAVWTRREAVGARVAVRLVMRLEEPLAAGARPLAGNVLESERFVPGTLLLGALAARALRSGRASEADFLRVFRGGGVLFPDLLPAAEEEGAYRPSLPAPADLFTCPLHPGAAEGQHGFWSAVLEDEDEPRAAAYDPVDDVRCPKCRQELRDAGAAAEEVERRQVKAIRVRPYLVSGAGSRYGVEPQKRQETKIQVDSATGRVREASLYHRELLATGTLLAGTLLADEAALVSLGEWGVLKGEQDFAGLHLGKRSGRGYGRATLAWVRVSREERENARADISRRAQALLEAGRSVPIMLTSRLLVRDTLGRAHRSLTPGVLGLGGGGRCAVEWGVVGGFWRHLGLPRRQDAALLAGSVLHWEPPRGEAAVLAERLAELEHGESLGGRTPEGFGRVAVAPFPYAWAAGEEPAEEALPLPDALRLAAQAGALRHGPAAELRGGWEADLAAAHAAFARDEWRTVARLLYVRAGDPLSELSRALTHGDGEPAAELARVRGRTPRSFLRDGDGQQGWKVLAPLLEQAAGPDLAPRERAWRTRALADALAAVSTPGRGTDA